jgi:hypothetical protein
MVPTGNTRLVYAMHKHENQAAITFMVKDAAGAEEVKKHIDGVAVVVEQEQEPGNIREEDERAILETVMQDSFVASHIVPGTAPHVTMKWDYPQLELVVPTASVFLVTDHVTATYPGLFFSTEGLADCVLLTAEEREAQEGAWRARMFDALRSLEGVTNGIVKWIPSMMPQ